MIYSTPEESFGIIGHVKNSTTAMERKEGLLESLPRAQERLADIQFCGSSVELAKEQTIAMIRSHPEITCMVGLNESSALGICQALAELELNGKIKVIACDSSQEQIQYMEQGMIQAFVIQQPFNMGYLGVQFAVDLANGKRVPENYDTGCIVVTKETLYTPENQKLLFPFTENE